MNPLHTIKHHNLFSYAKHKSVRMIRRMQGKKLLHFLHVGKTGGTAIKHAIGPYSIGRHYAIYLHSHNVRLEDVPVGDKVIFFLRDPISRFVSGFYSRQRQGKPRYFTPWNEGERRAFEEFHLPNQLAIALSSVDLAKKERAQAAMKHIEHVRDSYWGWFGSEEYFKSRFADVLFIGFQERLKVDFDNLKSIIGLPENVEIPSDDVQSHRNPEHLDKTLEDEAVVNLKHWYQDDFDFVALCKQLIEQYNLDRQGGASYLSAGVLNER